MDALLKINDLKTHFFTPEVMVRAFNGVRRVVSRGKTLSVPGESGCGEPVSALSILDLIPDPTGQIIDGSLLFEG